MRSLFLILVVAFALSVPRPPLVCARGERMNEQGRCVAIQHGGYRLPRTLPH